MGAAEDESHFFLSRLDAVTECSIVFVSVNFEHPMTVFTLSDVYMSPLRVSIISLF